MQIFESEKRVCACVYHFFVVPLHPQINTNLYKSVDFFVYVKKKQ